MLKRTFKRSHYKISANKCNGVFNGNQSKHESLCFVAQGNTASFFSALFFIFLYLTPFVTAYDKVQKSQLQEELSLWFQHLDVTRTLVTFLHSREERGKEKIKGKFHSYVDIASPVVLDLHMSGGRSQFGQAI